MRTNVTLNNGIKIGGNLIFNIIKSIISLTNYVWQQFNRPPTFKIL